VFVTEVSARKLGDAIVQTLDDEQKREEMGKRGFKRLHEDLNWDKSVQQLLAAYETALNGPK
jgi:glycosyltransferase involved in cell wall biosynthesis